jgi:hypothetical protein
MNSGSRRVAPWSSLSQGLPDRLAGLESDDGVPLTTSSQLFAHTSPIAVAV